MRRKRSLEKPRSDIIDTTSTMYDVACADPFKFLSTMRGADREASFDVETMGKAAHLMTGDFDEQEIDIARTIREVVDSKILVPRDVRIDDSGIPVAANLVEWCTKDKFSMINGERPYIEQIIWGIISYNEYCVAKGSYVFTGSGLKTVEDAVGNPAVTGMPECKFKTVTDSGVKYTSHGGMTSKRRKCLKITYASGHSITVTPEHRVQVLNSDLEQVWVRAEDLKIGQFGVMPYGANLWSKSNAKLKPGFVPGSEKAKSFKPLSRVTPELARLTGYLIADGFMNKNTIGFINTDDNLIEDFVHCCKSVFGHEPKVEVGFKATGKIKSKQGYKNVFLHGRSFVEWMYHIGFAGTDCYSKEIPNYILESTETIVANCLRAIFDCDGFVDYNRVGIVLSSRKCVQQISMLMQNFGIYGKHTESECNSDLIAHRNAGDVRSLRGSWVTKSVDAIDLYANKIGSNHAIKRINLESVRPRATSARSGNGTALPGRVPFCRELYARTFESRTEYHYKGLNSIKYGRRNFGILNDMLSDGDFVDTMSRLNPTDLNRLRKLAKSNNAYSEISVIEDAGFHEVYDLTVPSVENFVCNGVVVHNCPKCSDLEYLFHDHKVDDTYTKLERKVCMLEHGVCPSCKKGRSHWVKKGKMNFYQELAVCAGQRSGKSMSIAGYFAPYLTHRLLKLQNPNAFYGLKTGTMLHCTFVALTYAQAKDTLWQNFYATLTESAWFKEYHSMLRFYEGRYGEKLLKFNDTYVAYPTRGLMAYPAGPDKRVLRGRTRYFTSVDEIAYFDANRDTKKVKDNAHEVAGALDRSLLTVRGAAETLLKLGYDDVYPGYAMNVSSPVSRNDMIMTLVRRAENSKTMYGIVRPTWDVNPTLPRNGSTISEAYRTNPITAERDYGAVPPLASSPFIESENQIQDSFLLSKPNPIKIKRVVRRSKKRGESFTWAELDKTKGFKKPTIMTLDAGFTNNSFAGAIGYNDGVNVKVRAVFEVIPEPGAPLNHAKIFDELLIPLMAKFNVRILLADRWNSIKLLQDAKIEHENLELSEQHSLKYKEMHSIKTRLQQGTLHLPVPERDSIKDCLEFEDENYPMCFLNQPASHLIMQCATVKDTGKMVDKADGYTDDVFRATALLVWACEVDEYLEVLMAAPDDTTVTRPTAFAASTLGSGGGMAWGGGSGGGGGQSRMIGGYLPGRR